MFTKYIYFVLCFEDHIVRWWLLFMGYSKALSSCSFFLAGLYVVSAGGDVRI